MRNPISVYFSLALAMAIVGSSVVVGKLMVKTIPVFFVVWHSFFYRGCRFNDLAFLD
ncbi:hypothetical protein MOC99_05640 [Bacillus haynesii]|uniref:hypothetical protein n=1 Tax=Bacillus haynesii TaxID=1925021 RepID=UPI00227DF3A0|nr:hypothetical protein [Bacillus haynesii]MCY7912980.1 hypothetical protein [Bacillus haynesii]MCY7927184.1 hypothetical protein [Bacillus haynesii]MCY8344658.1 hypothetical protein [Bacillus haynesii]MCY8349340.1 hypothetical protein [Bacillus haynesii]MCY8771915.1 hypothetical protein [Bacillus haynesii]